MSTVSGPRPGHSTATPVSAKKLGTLVMRTASTRVPLLPVTRLDAARRRVQHQRALVTRGDEAVLQRDGHGPDSAVAAHGQAAAGFDEEQRDIGVGRERWIEHGTRHQVVAARLEHERPADPVVVAEEVLAPLAHGGAGKRAARRPPPRAQDCRRCGRRCRRRCGARSCLAPAGDLHPLAGGGGLDQRFHHGDAVHGLLGLHRVLRLAGAGGSELVEL